MLALANNQLFESQFKRVKPDPAMFPPRHFQSVWKRVRLG